MDFHEILGYLAAFLTTASFLPQVYKTWKTKSTEGLSLSMYTIFFTGIVCWLVYGIYLNSLPIILANTITGVSAFLLIVMKLKFK
ncbi:SemiSWEET family sugar transporter [Tenacibaculum sp. ZS6-P6]|uniref:SemiSWEET family sugar transporter n=1 Tax=Tenacibaculum sp. ZS6-P6 TaxID=3447503 RepID=UPI003F948A67